MRSILTSWVERSLHAKFQLELEVSLAPAEAAVGAVAKADQQLRLKQWMWHSSG